MECTACGVRLQVRGKGKFEIERHWETKHKDRLDKNEKASYKIVAEDFHRVDDLFNKKRKENPKGGGDKDDSGGDKDEEQIDNLELEETVEKESRKRGLIEMESEGGEGNGNVPKRTKGNVVDLLLKKVTDIDEKVTKIDKKLDDVGAQKTKLQKKAISDVVAGANSELSEDQVDFLMEKCKNNDELENVLEKVKIQKRDNVEDGVDGFFCEVCFDGSEPDWKNKDSIPGVFRFENEEPEEGEKEKQSEKFRNLKKNVRNHLKTKSHTDKKLVVQARQRADELNSSRQRKVGMNVFRERYQGIMQSKSLLDFERDILRAKLCGSDVGDVNHSQFFAKKLDVAIYDEMKDRLKKNMNVKLDATDEKRPCGLLMDKMTPNRRTGQMHAAVVAVPENSLAQVSLLV